MRPCLLILLLAFSGAGLSQSPLSSTLQRKGPFWDERSANRKLPEQSPGRQSSQVVKYPDYTENPLGDFQTRSRIATGICLSVHSR